MKTNHSTRAPRTAVVLRRCVCAALAAGLGLTAACRGDTVGPCEVTYGEPVLRIVLATDAASGAPIPRVALTDLQLDGRRFDGLGLQLLAAFPDPSGVAIWGDSLICTVGCAFGDAPGRYRFTAKADGYAPQTFEFDARYAVNRLGCPAHYTGSTRVGLQLRSE